MADTLSANPRNAAALYALGRPYGQGASRDEKRTSAHAIATLARANNCGGF